MPFRRHAVLVLVLVLAGCGEEAQKPLAANPADARAAAPTPVAEAAQPASPAPAAPPVAARGEPGAAPQTPAPEPMPGPAPAQPAAAPAPPIVEAQAPAVPVAQPAAAPPAPAAAAPPIPPPVAPVATPPVAEPAPAPLADEAALLTAVAIADTAAGEAAAAARCGPCHSFGAGEGTLVGPNLYEIVGAAVGRMSGFAYSAAFRALGAEGAVWTYGRLDAFLADPSLAIPGTRMGVGGIPDQRERASIIAYLRLLAATPVPLAGADRAMIPEGLGPVTITTEQIDFGRDLYDRFCARCHGFNQLGLINENEWGEAPNLIGPIFVDRWFSRPVYDLFNLIKTLHLPDDRGGFNHGGLGIADERYAQIVAYLLSRNGFQPGPTPLPFDEAGLHGIGFYQ